MSKEAEKLADKCTLISKTLVHVGGRTGAVEWMADASGALFDCVALLRRQAEQIRELREATRDLVDCYCEIGNPMSKNDRMRHMLALNKARVLSNTKEEI